MSPTLSTRGQHFRLGAAQQRPHPRHEFRRRERLHQIVVGAGRKTAHAVALLAARGQHDDRQALRLRPHPQPPAELDAGDRRHHPVEHEKVGSVLLQPDLGLVAARDDLDLVALGLQIVAQEHAERLLVFHHHDLRRDHLGTSLPVAYSASTASAVSSSLGRFTGSCSPVTT